MLAARIRIKPHKLGLETSTTSWKEKPAPSREEAASQQCIALELLSAQNQLIAGIHLELTSIHRTHLHHTP